VPRFGVVGMAFSLSLFSLFSGIPDFQFQEIFRSQILRVIETFDRLICRSLNAIA
jgi:hypothetical protein